MTDYVSKNFTNPDTCYTTESMIRRFYSLCDKVPKIFDKDGPIYHTWIRFQVGSQNNSKSVVFNTDSTNPYENLITNLSVTKSGSNTANTFTLNIYYDPFNHGQETQNQIEKLDEILADALSLDIQDNTDNLLKGFLQYGYVTDSDTDLVSPKYQFILTDAKSNVDCATGITNYTFMGTTALAVDCEFKTHFDKIEKGTWKFMDVILWTLYYHYGDINNPPDHITGTPSESANNFKYRIDCPSALYDDTLQNEDWEGTDAVDNMSPWQYCIKLLNENPLTKSEKSSGKFDDWNNLDTSKKPYYTMYFTETNKVKTIHIVHISPGSDSDIYKTTDLQKLVPTITWGMQKSNIAIKWNPSVDTKTYLIRQALVKRTMQKFKDAELTFDKLKEKDNITSDVVKIFSRDNIDLQPSLIENFNAELTLVGLPCDIPISAKLRIVPRILESVSRTAGTYIVKGATDTIDINGTYTTTLQLFRTGNLAEDDLKQQYSNYNDWYKATYGQDAPN